MKLSESLVPQMSVSEVTIVDEWSYLSPSVFEMFRDPLSVFFSPSSKATSPDQLTREQCAVLGPYMSDGRYL